MPRRDNLNLSETPFAKDLRGLHDASDSYDKDNVFLTDEGWVYRHYKKADKSKFWDEIIVAGEVVSDAGNDPVEEVNEASPTFETGDGTQDFEYSPTVGAGGGGGAPADTVIGVVSITGAAGPVANGDSETYTVDTSNATAGSLTYQWTADDDAAINGSSTGSSVNIDFTNAGGTGSIGVTVSSSDANFDGNDATATLAVVVSA